MCNACGFYCCGSDVFDGCGCDGCPEPECWSDEPDDDADDDYYPDDYDSQAAAPRRRHTHFRCEQVSP